MSFTTLGIEPKTVSAATILPPYVRVRELPYGRCVLADAATRGDFVTLERIPATKTGRGAAISHGGTVPIAAAEDVRAGDAAYGAPEGKCGKKSPGSAHVGKWIDNTKRGDVGQVELIEKSEQGEASKMYRMQL